MLKVLDLFSGIGGFSLGLERAGMRTIAFCEIDEYCRAVLRKHWSGVPIYNDIRTVTGRNIRADCFGGDTIDLICGGPPCQRTSCAAAIHGKRTGETLWSEQHRLIEEVRPQWAIIEQPPGNKKWEAAVQGDLEGVGYHVSRHEPKAAGVGAPHLRRRVFFVANRDGERLEVTWPAGSSAPQDENERITAQRDAWLQNFPRTLRVDDGFPKGLDGLERNARIHALGNAVVPQVVEQIGRAIIGARS